MLDAARRKYRGVAAATFTSSWDAVAPADYVIASGIFNVRLGAADQEWLDYVLDVLAMLNAKATIGWTANFLSGYADEERKRPEVYYAAPAAIFDWCKRKAS